MLWAMWRPHLQTNPMILHAIFRSAAWVRRPVFWIPRSALLAVAAWVGFLGQGCSEAVPAAAPADAKPEAAASDAVADSGSADSAGRPLIPDGGSITVEVDGTVGPWAQACLQAPTLCDDSNPCTIDGCDPIAGCTTQVKACVDDDACTLDKCDVKTGDCNHAVDTCEDSNACTTGACAAGVGCTFIAINCSDGAACTLDGCSPQTGCSHAAVDCNDGKTCTIDYCDSQKGCVNTAPLGAKCCEIANDCDDGDACTAHMCLAGVCSTVPLIGCCKKAADCDDDNACTQDQCAVATGQCKHTAKQTLGCCASDIDCDDATLCTADKCVNNVCGHEPTCCTVAADCADTVSGVLACADATCTTGGCSSVAKIDPVTKSAPSTCCTPQIAMTGFETTDSWQPSFVASQYGQWQLLPTVGKSGVGAQFMPVPGGVPGGGSVAQLRMPAVTLPIGVDVKLKFSLKGQVQPGDSFRLRATTSVGSWWIWQGGANPTVWSTYTVDLTALAARAATHKVKLTWELLNGKGSPVGLFLDDLAITSICKAKACVIDVQCNDNFGFSAEACVGGTCAYTPGKDYCEIDASVCNDNNACTSDYCSNFSCYHSKIFNCCLKIEECNDNKVCTTEVCINNSCQFTAIGPDKCCEKDLDCNDNKVCTKDFCPQIGLACAHTKTAADCCDNLGDCDDGNPCSSESCTKNVCGFKNICCKEALDCDDGDPICTNESCVNGLCQWTKLVKPGCCDPILQQADLESGLPAWMQLTSTSATVKWQLVTSKEAKSGSTALYYGDVAKGSFDDGTSHSGTVSSKEALTMPKGSVIKFSFWLWMDTEGGGYDEFKVNVISPQGKNAAFVKSTYPKWVSSQWMQIEVDLSAYAGMAISVELDFNTVDQIGNQGKGVYVDDWLLSRTCD